MPKSSPEKLAKALRANLKKRKLPAGEGAADTPENPPKSSESRSEPADPAPAGRPKG